MRKKRTSGGLPRIQRQGAALFTGAAALWLVWLTGDPAAAGGGGRESQRQDQGQGRQRGKELFYGFFQRFHSFLAFPGGTVKDGSFTSGSWTHCTLSRSCAASCKFCQPFHGKFSKGLDKRKKLA